MLQLKGMKNIQSDEDGKRSLLTAILVTILAVIALLMPSPPNEEPVHDEQVPPVSFIHTAYADEIEPKVVRISTTTDQVTEMVVEKPVQKPDPQSIESLADAIIECESSGRNVEIIDTNGKWSRGIAQFQDATWAWMSVGAGIQGSSTEPEKARAVLIWALQNGYGMHWTCYRKIIGYQ